MLRRILALITPLVAGCTTTTFASLSRRSSFFTRPVKPPGIRETFASTRAPGMASLMADRAPRTTESPITLTGPFAARISSSDVTGSPLSVLSSVVLSSVVLSSVVVLLSVASGSAADSVGMSAVAFASAASGASDVSSSMAGWRGAPSRYPWLRRHREEWHHGRLRVHDQCDGDGRTNDGDDAGSNQGADGSRAQRDSSARPTKLARARPAEWASPPGGN